MSESAPEAWVERLRERASAMAPELSSSHGEWSAAVDCESLVSFMELVRDDEAFGFGMLIDLTAVDRLDRSPRFELVYHLYSIAHNRRLRVKLAGFDESAEVDSVTRIWPAANWMEREVFDLYGIRFCNHPDLRRILLDEGFEGHPLRKDHPKQGRGPLARVED